SDNASSGGLLCLAGRWCTWRKHLVTRLWYMARTARDSTILRRRSTPLTRTRDYFPKTLLWWWTRMGKVVHRCRVPVERYVVYGTNSLGNDVEHGRFDVLGLAVSLCNILAKETRDQTFWVVDTLE